MLKNKNWKNKKKWKTAETIASEKTWHNTDPPQQLHWVRIILRKLDTIQNHHTNRDTKLLGFTMIYLYYNDNVL
jgi:hypothetical protein